MPQERHKPQENSSKKDSAHSLESNSFCQVLSWLKSVVVMINHLSGKDSL